MRKINSQSMRENNTRMILHKIRKNSVMSRVELAKELDLTSPAITYIVSDLLKNNVLSETGSMESSKGRRPVMLSLNPDACRVMGVLLTTESVSVILTDYCANILARSTSYVGGVTTREGIIELLLDCCRKCIEQCGAKSQDILAIGLAMPGTLDTRTGMLIAPPNFSMLHNVNICKIVEDALGIPAVLENETNAASLAEYHFAMEEEFKTIFYLMLFKGSVGGSIMIDGNIAHGFYDGAGEIGHSLVDINGPLCTCGQYGCLERVASGDAMLKEAKALLKSMRNANVDCPYTIDDLTLEDVFSLAKSGVHMFSSVVDNAARMYAAALGNLISFISPSKIIIGRTGKSFPTSFVEKIKEYVHGRSYPSHIKDVEITQSKLGDEACVLGVAIEKHQLGLCKRNESL